MSVHNTPRTIRTDAAGLGEPGPPYDPYASQPDDNFSHSMVTGQPKQSRNGCLADFYGVVSWTLGFREKFSLALLIFLAVLSSDFVSQGQ